MLDFQAPIILVGAGRSGSTLLDSVIGAHPKVQSISETGFLMHRLWEVLLERRSFFKGVSYWRALEIVARKASVGPHGFGPDNLRRTFHRLRSGTLGRGLTVSWKDLHFTKLPRLPKPAFEGSAAAIEEIRGEIEDTRLARALGESLVRLLIPPELVAPRWMFREIWVGSPAFSYDYSLFATAFPKARYVQVIRHPIDYLSSLAKTQGVVPDDDSAVRDLHSWVAMVQAARALAQTQPYFEIRYKDLVTWGEPVRALFDFLDLDMHPRCRERLDIRVVATDDSLHLGEHATRWIDATPGLRPIMQGLDFPDQPFGRLRPEAKTLEEWRQAAVSAPAANRAAGQRA